METPPNFPDSFLVGAWRCLIQRRKEWLIAHAITTAMVRARNNGDWDVWEALTPFYNRYWKRVYREENPE